MAALGLAARHAHVAHLSCPLLGGRCRAHNGLDHRYGAATEGSTTIGQPRQAARAPPLPASPTLACMPQSCCSVGQQPTRQFPCHLPWPYHLPLSTLLPTILAPAARAGCRQPTSQFLISWAAPRPQRPSRLRPSTARGPAPCSMGPRAWAAARAAASARASTRRRTRTGRKRSPRRARSGLQRPAALLFLTSPTRSVPPVLRPPPHVEWHLHSCLHYLLACSISSGKAALFPLATSPWRSSLSSSLD